MQNSESQAKRRYNIFKTKLFPDSPSFKKVPLHFDFTPTVTCVFDHCNQTINTYSNKLKRPKRAGSQHKIFGARRTVSQQKSALSSAEQTSRCASFCGEKRNHSIFSKPKKVRFSSEESLKENEKQTIQVKMMKTQSRPQKQEICLAKAVANPQQIQRFYRSQLQQKLRMRQQQKVVYYHQVQNQPNITQNETFDILKPQQFAKMIKQVRMATKYKRNQIVFTIPKPLHQVTYHQNFYMVNNNAAKSREALIYRI